MGTSRLHSLAILCPALCLALVGCFHTVPVVCDPPEPVPHLELPVVERGALEPDGAAVPDKAPAYRDGPPPTYKSLAPGEAQCQAVRAASLANRLDREREAVVAEANKFPARCSKQQRKLAEVRQVILANSALEVRNFESGKALALYYRLAETEAKASLAGSSLTTMIDTVARADEFKQKGLKLPVDRETLVRQEIDLRISRTQSQLGVDQLNSELIPLLGMEPCKEDWRIWPADEFAVDPSCIDIDAAVADGLASRAELVLLRYLLHELDAETLPVVNQMIGALNGLLTMSSGPPACPCLAKMLSMLHCAPGKGEELEARRRQLEDLLAERERSVAHDIKQAAQAMAAEVELIALNRRKAESWHDRVREQEDKTREGIGSFLDLTTAQLEWRKARGDVVKEVIAWHLARVRLKQSQGVLPLECGFHACAPCGKEKHKD